MPVSNSGSFENKKNTGSQIGYSKKAKKSYRVCKGFRLKNQMITIELILTTFKSSIILEVVGAVV